MNSKFYILCVLYNDSIDNIASVRNFQALKNNHTNVEIIVVDNSELECVKTKSKAYSERLIYIDNNGNKGLSNAYNKAISLIHDTDYWLMLADDDTEFSLEFLEAAYSAAMKHEHSLICGLVKTDTGSLSPTRRNTVFRKQDTYISDTGVYSDIFCINSGMIIHSEVLDAVGPFEERIFLDMLDYWFMDQLIEKRLNTVEVVEGDIYQHFSGNERADKEALLRRFTIYKKDFSTYCRLTDKSIPYKYGVLLKRTLSIYKTVYINNSIKKISI